MLVSGRAGPLQGHVALGQESPPPVVIRPDPGDSPRPAPPVPPLQPTKTVDRTPKAASTVSIAAPTRKAPQMAAPPPSFSELPPLAAKPTKPSKWWMLLLIIPAIATALAVVALRFQPARRVQEFQKTVDELAGNRLTGQLDLMGDSLTRWSRRAPRQVGSIRLRRARRDYFKKKKKKKKSSSLTTLDPKSLRES